MKKIILAAAIAGITANAATAATVYEGNGLKYQVKGDFQIQLRKDLGNDQHLDVEFDDLELKNRIEYDLGGDMKAFGQLDFGFKNAAEGKQSGSKLEEAYVGLDFGSASVAVGKMDFAGDSFGIDQAYENKLAEDRFDAQGTSGDDVILVKTKIQNVNVILSHELQAKGESSTGSKFTDLYLDTNVAGVDLAFAYQTKGSSEDTWGVSASVDAGIATLAAEFSTSDLGTGDVDQINLAAIIPVAKTTKVAVGINNVDDASKAKDATEWYANVTYKFAAQKNVSLFAEIADTDEANVDLGYLAGLRVKF